MTDYEDLSDDGFDARVANFLEGVQTMANALVRDFGRHELLGVVVSAGVFDAVQDVFEAQRKRSGIPPYRDELFRRRIFVRTAWGEVEIRKKDEP